MIQIKAPRMDYLTTLPVELIHKILDYIPTFDIFLSLYMINKRLRFISMTYPRFQPNFSDRFKLLKKDQFDFICTQILQLTPQIISLTLFDKDDPMTPIRNAFFFSKVNNTKRIFSNLRSLTLTYIDYETWILFKTRLPSSIRKLSIHLIHNGRPSSSSSTSEIICEFLFYSTVLEYLSLKLSNYSENLVSIRRRNPVILSSIQYFHLDGITIDLSSLFTIVPRLHTLEVSFHNSNRIFDTIQNHPSYLKRLRLELYAITWTKTATLLSSFSRLDYLTVIADDLDSDMADGERWAKLLQEIKHFECKLQFCWNAFSEQSINLDSFRTKFWLEDKKWFLTYEQNIDEDYSILRSNSSSTIDYLSNEIIGILMSDSSKFDSTNLPIAYCLTIHYQYVKYALLHRSIQVKQLNLTEVDVKFPLTFKDISNYLDLSRIVTSYPSTPWISKSSYDMIQFMRNTPNLRALSISGAILDDFTRHQWPNIIYLRIEYDSENTIYSLCSNNIDAICNSFVSLETFDINLLCIDDLKAVLNRLKKMSLTEIIIRQSHTINSEQFISYEWIKRHTELQNFHYACDAEKSVSLWL